MPVKKTRNLKSKRDLQRQQAIAAAINKIEKTEHKLDLELKRLKRNLVTYRFFCS